MYPTTRLAVGLTAFLFLLAACDGGLTDAPATLADGDAFDAANNTFICHVGNELPPYNSTCDPETDTCGDAGQVSLVEVKPKAADQHLDNPSHCYDGQCDYLPEGDVTAEDAAEDTDGNGVAEACEPDEPSGAVCPCYTLADLQAVGEVEYCGDTSEHRFVVFSIEGFQDTATACSGVSCWDPAYISCAIYSTFFLKIDHLTVAQDQACRSLLSDPALCGD